jgi:anthranilate phosphoribosyltransferase
MDLYHQVFAESGQNYLIVHSLDGYDEISLTGDARYVSNKRKTVFRLPILVLPRFRLKSFQAATRSKMRLKFLRTFSKAKELRPSKM